MAFIPAPNAVRICLQMVWAGQTVEICLAFLKNSAVSLIDMSDLADGLEIWRQDELRPLISGDVTFTQWYALSLTSSSSPSLIAPITVDTAGGDSTLSVANNVALVTTFQTDLRGRSYRGRAYTPGIYRGRLTSSTEVGASFAGELNDAYATLNANVPTGWTHIVISNQLNGVVRTTAARTPVTGYRTENRLDSQRRRLEGRGT